MTSIDENNTNDHVIQQDIGTYKDISTSLSKVSSSGYQNDHQLTDYETFMTDFDDEVDYDDDGIDDLVGLENKLSEGFNFLEDDEENSDMVDPLVSGILSERSGASYSILPTTAYLLSDTVDYSQLTLFDFFRTFINNDSAGINDGLVESGILEIESLTNRTDSVMLIDDYISQLGNINVSYCGDENALSSGFINELIDIVANSTSLGRDISQNLLMGSLRSGMLGDSSLSSESGSAQIKTKNGSGDRSNYIISNWTNPI